MLGIIGLGAMGSAILNGALGSGKVKADEVIIFDKDVEKLKPFELKGVRVCEGINEMLESCDYLILAIKPHIYDQVLGEIASIKKDVVIITIAVGYEIKKVLKILGKEARVIRSMPNTPAQILEGVTGYCKSKNVRDEDIAYFINVFSGFSKTFEIEEEKMHIFAAIAGSMPAFVDIFIEACSEAAVLEGLPRQLSYEIVAESISGSAKMVKDTKIHPAVLKDAVTSPGGTTIEGVRTLENFGFRRALIETIINTTKKSKKLFEE